jgi:hypothetical protein
MSAVTKDPEELWKPFDVLIGGIGTLEAKPFTDIEGKRFDRFISDSVNVLEKISPEVAADFRENASFFKSVGEVFKAKVDKAFAGILPSSGQFGVGLIIPQDIRYVATPSSAEPAYSDYSLNSWDISLTAGTEVFLLGSSTAFYKARPTVGSRCTLVIMKNGIIEVGTTPSINQLRVITERTSYPVLSVHPLVDQPIEEGYVIYRYNFPFNLPVFYDFGVKLSAMPMVSRTSNIRLVGVVFYEYDHRSSLRYVS